jgi:hypothetical protein
MVGIRRKESTPAKADKPGKGAKNAPKGATPEGGGGRIAQMRAVYAMAHESDPRILWWILLPALGALAIVFVVVGIVLGHIIYGAILAIGAALLAATFFFGRRATAAMYSQVEGRPGAAAAVLQGMRGDWRVTPAVAFNRNQDLVHRVVGRPGIVLVGEGTSPARVQQLLTQEKKRVARVAAEVPTYEVIVGDSGEKAVSVRDLQRHLGKLPRNLKRNQLDAVEGRMRALGGQNMPIPKGPIPTRVPRGKMR